MKMDLQEWELIPDDGFLEINDDGGKKIFSRRYEKSVFQTNYFICPSSPINSPKFVETTIEDSVVPRQIVHVPIQLELPPPYEKDLVDQVPTQIKSVIVAEKIQAPKIGDLNLELETDGDESVSQVFFKKMKENEFVDMKLDSPKSGSSSSSYKGDAMESKKIELGSEVAEKTSWEEEEDNNGGVNMWKWCFSGIGAICSFGIAATTICIVILGSNHKNKHHHKLKFQIYTHDKRINEVVQNANKLNEAIAAARGVSLTRAHITFGGCYEAL